MERDEVLARTFFSRARLMQYGGAGLSQNVVDRVQAVARRTVGEHISFASGYGATETGPTACNVHWPNLRAGLCGLPIPGTSIKLAPVADKLELRAKGIQISPGYYNAPDGQADPFDEEGYYRLGDAGKLVDPERPSAGLVFDGRLVENFKLASGTFVGAGALRLSALSAVGGAAIDAVVCGEGCEGVGLLLFADLKRREALGGEMAARRAIEAGLLRLERRGHGPGWPESPAPWCWTRRPIRLAAR